MVTLESKDRMDNHNYYDTDDDIVDPDPQTPPVLTLLNPKDLPIPDADYVAKLVSEEFHPFLAKKCKKDCRTWLWKSRSQREAVLAKQRKDFLEKGVGERQSAVNNKA